MTALASMGHSRRFLAFIVALFALPNPIWTTRQGRLALARTGRSSCARTFDAHPKRRPATKSRRRSTDRVVGCQQTRRSVSPTIAGRKKTEQEPNIRIDQWSTSGEVTWKRRKSISKCIALSLFFQRYIALCLQSAYALR